MHILRIENALLWAGVKAETVADAALQAVDGELTYVGPKSGLPAVQGEVEGVDAQGMLLMPGLVNAHTHLAMTLFRGYADDMPLKPWLEEKIWPIETRLRGEDVYWGSLLGIVEMLRGGVTCFNDMYHCFEDGTRAA
ncbi:MAG: amidohydrolase family protein, partial [Armatimonadota bacterium]